MKGYRPSWAATREENKLYDIYGGRKGFLSKSASTEIDEKNYRVPVIITTEAIDSDGDILLVSGGDWKRHRKNPAVLCDHDWSDPIACAEVDGQYSVTVNKSTKQVVAVSQFNPKVRSSDEAFAMIAAGIMRGASVGIRYLKADPRIDEGDDEPSHRRGLMVSSYEVYEYSHVVLPANPDAIVQAYSRKSAGGVKLTGNRLRMLKAMQPELSGSVSVGIDLSKLRDTSVGEAEKFDKNRDSVQYSGSADGESANNEAKDGPMTEKNKTKADECCGEKPKAPAAETIEQPKEEAKPVEPSATNKAESKRTMVKFQGWHGLHDVYDLLGEIERIAKNHGEVIEHPGVAGLLNKISAECGKARVVTKKAADEYYPKQPAFMDVSADMIVDSEERFSIKAGSMEGKGLLKTLLRLRALEKKLDADLKEEAGAIATEVESYVVNPGKSLDSDPFVQLAQVGKKYLESRKSA